MSIIDWIFGKKNKFKTGIIKAAEVQQSKAETYGPVTYCQKHFASTTYTEQSQAEIHTPIVRPVADEQYVKDCLQQKYYELSETRSYSDPAFQKVLDQMNSGDNVAACREAEALIVEFSDFASLYYWWGSALQKIGSLDKARQVLRGGLEKAKKKYMLCNCMGEVEWKTRNLDQAVYWWSQGIHCQESLNGSNYGHDVGAYLYLYYVSEGLKLFFSKSCKLSKNCSFPF
jgi:hypothetical protein